MKILNTYYGNDGSRLYSVLFSETEDQLLGLGLGVGAGALAGRGIARKVSAKKIKKSLQDSGREQIKRGKNRINALADNFKGGRDEAIKLADDITAIKKQTARNIEGRGKAAKNILKKAGRKGALIGAGVGGALVGGALLAEKLQNQERVYSRGGGIKQKLFFDYSALEYENPELAKKVRERRSELAREIRRQRNSAFERAKDYNLKTTEYVRKQGGSGKIFKNAPELFGFRDGKLSPERTAEIDTQIRGLDDFKNLQENNRKTYLRRDLEDITKQAEKNKRNLGIDLGKDHKLIGKDGKVVSWDQGKMNIFRDNQTFKDGKWVDIPKKQPNPEPKVTPQPEPKFQGTSRLEPQKPQVTSQPKPEPKPQTPNPPATKPPVKNPSVPKPKPMKLGTGGKIAIGATLGAGLLAGGAYLLGRDKKEK